MILKDISRTDSFEYWPLFILSTSVIMSITLLFYFYRNIKLIPEIYKLRASSSEIIDDTRLVINEDEMEEPINEFHPIKIWSFIFSSIHLMLGCFFTFNFIKKQRYNDIEFHDIFWLFVVTFIFFLFSGLSYFISLFLISKINNKIKL